MNRLFVLAISLLCAHEVSAQVLDSAVATEVTVVTKDSVVVHKDPRVDLLVNKQIEINEFTTRASRRAAPGYRILVISSNDRKKVIDAKTKMYREFPELKVYMMYQSPFFRLKVGNFREREEAEEHLLNIQRFYPTGAYVVTDTIEVRPE